MSNLLEKNEKVAKFLKLFLIPFTLIILSIFIAICTDMYANIIEMETSFLELLKQNFIEQLSFKKILVFSFIYAIIFESLYIIKLKTNKVIDELYKYRFVISGVILLLCLVFQISGSSIGLYNQRFNLDQDVFNGEILGKRKNN